MPGHEPGAPHLLAVGSSASSVIPYVLWPQKACRKPNIAPILKNSPLEPALVSWSMDSELCMLVLSSALSMLSEFPGQFVGGAQAMVSIHKLNLAPQRLGDLHNQGHSCFSHHLG